MNDAFKGVIERIKADKRTTWAAYLIVALVAAGEALSQYGVEPWGTMVSGVGGFLAGGVLLFTQFSKPPAPMVQLQAAPPPQDQPPPGAS